MVISSTQISKGFGASSSEQSADVDQATAISTLADGDRPQNSHPGRRLRFAESDQSRERGAEPDWTPARGSQGNVHQFHRIASSEHRTNGTNATNGERHGRAVEGRFVRERTPNTVIPNRLLMMRRFASTASATARRRRGSSSPSLDGQRVASAVRLVGLTVLSGVFALCLALMLYFSPPYPPPSITGSPPESHNHSHHHRHHHSRHSQHPPVRPSTPP